MSAYTVSTLPNNIPNLRTGTANDGRMLVYAGQSPERQESVLHDLRARLPAGWTAEIYVPSGVDVVITHAAEDIHAQHRADAYDAAQE